MNGNGFIPARWLPGPHGQTLWGRFFRRLPRLKLRHERWETPDSDIVDVYRLAGEADAPHLLLLHGLEGGLHSHYARGMLAEAQRRGWHATLLIWRSCGPELNLLPRFYHSGDTVDARMALEWILREEPDRLVVMAGVSLGGNVLLRLLAEEGADTPARLVAAAAISVPFDLARSARQIQRGFARVYQRHFVRSLKRKALAKLRLFESHFNRDAIARAVTLYDFDESVTAPLHGFAGAEDYYSRSSSLPVLDRIRIPTILLSAVDDPFLPPDVLDDVRAVARGNEYLKLLFVPKGGHVGFVSGTPWQQTYWAEARAFEFLAARVEERRTAKPLPTFSGGIE
jgi:predicted alpha/beta-fold hydrolase